LNSQAPLVVLDTSAVIDFIVWISRKNRNLLHDFREVISETWSAPPQFVYHPATLLEIATNAHEEVLLSRRGRSNKRFEDVRRDSKRFRAALIALREMDQCDEEWAILRPRQISLQKDFWSLLLEQRSDWRLLRCTKKDGVIPVATMVDHMILGVALSLNDRGIETGLVTGDRDLAGAARKFSVPIVYTKQLSNGPEMPWKSCANDETCIQACAEATTDCHSQFIGSA